MGHTPNLFIPGFQKCATSTLFDCLICHPDIGHASHWAGMDRKTFPKEAHFFDNAYEEGLSFYESLYRGVNAPFRIDATPTYLTNDNALSRIISICPNARFIVSMRNPVDRLFSSWNHWSQLESENRWPVPRPEGTLAQNLEAEMNQIERNGPGGGFLGTGFYASHIEMAFKHASPDQFYFLFAEQLETSFEAIMCQILDFLELKPIHMPGIRSHKRNRSVPDLSKRMRFYLEDYFQEENKKLSALLQTTVPW